jgi:hypothetical protein
MSRGDATPFKVCFANGRCGMDRRRVDAFRVLGIPTDSDPDAVVRAYRRLARVTHPDLSNDPDAAECFATVAAAYQLLSQDPRTASISVRIHEPRPGDEGRAQGRARAERWMEWGGPAVHSWTRPTVTLLGARRDERPPIVAGPAWVSSPRRPDDREVRGG